jgi:hypothetical protein
MTMPGQTKLDEIVPQNFQAVPVFDLVFSIPHKRNITNTK